MSAKAIRTGAVILAALGGWAGRAHGQYAAPPKPNAPEQLPAPAAPATSPVPNIVPAPGSVANVDGGLPPGTVPDPWITYERPSCCGPIGGHGPIDSELYVRSGVAILTGDSIIRRSVHDAWIEEVGGRSIFFNAPTTFAWTADFGIDYSIGDGRGGHNFTIIQPFNVTTFNNQGQAVNRVNPTPLNVTIRDYQRAAVRFAGGYEWYIGNPAYCPGTHWRVGADLGGRWGWSRLDLNDLTNAPVSDFRHISDVYGALELAIHSDLEFQIGPRSWLILGGRAEWAYNWSDILKKADNPPQLSDTQEIGLLFTIGVRF
jgi:hypothetical protein